MNSRVLVLTAVLTLVVSRPAFTQSAAEGTIRGVIHDEQGSVLVGAAISATSPAIAGTVATVSDSDGSYRLINLYPGEYAITVTLQGFSSHIRSGVVVRAGLHVGVDIVLKIGSVSESVRVTAESPMLEIDNPVQAINVSGGFQRSLPLGLRRDVSDFLEITPGVTARTYDQGTGGQVYMLRGSEIENHVVQLDGADMGSFRQGWAGLFVGLSTDAIEDTQVKTAGVDATAPMAVGVIVNIATPSGTNHIKGAMSTVVEAKSWNGSNAAPGDQSVYNKVLQTDLSVGGPVLRDKVFFFGAFRYADRETGVFRTADQLKRLAAIDSAFTPFSNGGQSKYYFIKATAQVATKYQFYAFYQRDLNPEVASFPTDSKPFNVSAFGGNGVGTRLASVWNPSLSTRLLMAYNDKSVNGTFDVFSGRVFSNPAQAFYSASFVSAGRRTGNGLLGTTNTISLMASPASKMTAQGDLIYYRAGWIGSHELQTGFFAQPRLSNRNDLRYANGGAAFDELVLVNANDLTSGSVSFHHQVYDAPAVTSSWRVARDYAVYTQDAWKPSSRLTVNVGLRVDKVMVRDELFGADVQNSWEIGPRFGGTYILTSDGKNVGRANWGRVADLLQPGYLPSAGSNAVGVTDYYDNDLDGVFETVLRTPAVTSQSSNQVIDPHRHQPFIDEWIVGYRRQLARQVSADVAFVRRYYRDRPALQEINRIMNGVMFAGYRNEAQNNVFFVTNNIWNTQVYSGLELTITKRTRALNGVTGYTRGWQHLDGTWIPGDPASFIQPDAFPNDKGIGTIRGNETNSLAGGTDTRSPSWQKHTLRAGVAYDGPWNTLVASNLVILSGPYSGPVVTRIAAPDPQFGPPTVRLPDGRVVTNPLATTIRFAYSTRGEGQIKAPNLVRWNIRVGRYFSLGPRRLHAAVDVINVLNNDADQQFQAGGNQLYNTTSYAIAPDGSFRGQSRQPPRSAQITLRFEF